MRPVALLALLSLAGAGCRAIPNYSLPLPEGAPALIPLEADEPQPDFGADWDRRAELLPALDRSIDWTRRESSRRHFPMAGISHTRALASLERFREILTSSLDRADFVAALEREFTVYKSAGWDGRGGGVLFTGYCTPELEGSTERDGRHQFPLYGLPDDLEKGPDGEILGWRTAFGRLQYPSRQAIEAGGLFEGKGMELVWLADPIDAYLAHVNGSAFVRLADGSLLRLGYAGKNGRAYTSLGRELIADGELPVDGAGLEAIRRWAASSSPEKVQDYLFRNESYVFFTPIDGRPRGSLNVEVEPRRSVATDKSLFPRGALTFVECALPESAAGPAAPFRSFLLDQDTGGAIRTAGRADLYLGVGDDAERLAGRVKSEGQLYYLFISQ